MGTKTSIPESTRKKGQARVDAQRGTTGKKKSKGGNSKLKAFGRALLGGGALKTLNRIEKSRRGGSTPRGKKK